jgi:inosine/xanthosine triphosphate pyrophosphatase family protein
MTDSDSKTKEIVKKLLEDFDKQIGEIRMKNTISEETQTSKIEHIKAKAKALLVA